MQANQTHADRSVPEDNVSIPLNELLGDRRYTWISHGKETYLLQLTKANKLLLTK